jgi:hypothetical protein
MVIGISKSMSNYSIAESFKRFVVEIINSSKGDRYNSDLLPEVRDSLEYKDIIQLYKNIASLHEQNSENGLFGSLIRQFVVTKNESLESLILEIFMKAQFKMTDFGRYMTNLFFIMSNNSKSKQMQLKIIVQDLYDLINHSTNTLNVTDIKNLKQVSVTIEKFKELFTKLYDLFIIGFDDSDTDAGKVKGKTKEIAIADENSLDLIFTKLFIKTKNFLVIMQFLKLCSKVKIEAARNVLKGSSSLGLHAVTISKELLKVIELCNYILINFCKSRKARV